jgi:hypothetical protein
MESARWDRAEMRGSKEPGRSVPYDLSASDGDDDLPAGVAVLYVPDGVGEHVLQPGYSMAPQLAGICINDSTIGCVLFASGVASRGRVTCYASARLERKVK